MIAFKWTPELNSYTAPHLERLVQSRKAFQSSREKVNKTRYGDETKWSYSHWAEITTGGKRCRWDSSQGLRMSSEDNTKEWFRRRFWNILAQDFIIWLSCRMLAVKYIYLCQNIQGILTKIFQLSVQMLDNQDNDAHLRWVVAMSVQYKDGWNGAYDTMQLP